MMASTGEGFHGLHQFAVIASGFLKVDEKINYDLVDNVMRLSFYAGMTAIFLMIGALLVKLMWNCDGDGGGRPADENSRLLCDDKDVVDGYGATDGGTDLESGSSWTSSEDLYDGKVCVICYDDPRQCCFVPCGHCIACHACATRIMKQESRSCPICRGIIDKIRKLVQVS